MKINVNGKDVEAIQVGFAPVAGEPFVEYILDDGNTVRVKIVMTRIFATGERNTQTNEPIYSLQWQPVAIVEEKQRNGAAN